ncbi:hypothetical protein BDY19DRAFT_733657 [Irpex rosettiformis]|uniref:Uncharacterized protein n=1 Tax=Irpex rosettiformis TaxID=378272 RepID=A0ACB8U8Z4_9APHY|nr:hypothetical protein BDY19DRAFT_733657 [Irpex rosettiformis]
MSRCTPEQRFPTRSFKQHEGTRAIRIQNLPLISSCHVKTARPQHNNFTLSRADHICGGVIRDL